MSSQYKERVSARCRLHRHRWDIKRRRTAARSYPHLFLVGKHHAHWIIFSSFLFRNVTILVWIFLSMANVWFNARYQAEKLMFCIKVTHRHPSPAAFFFQGTIFLFKRWLEPFYSFGLDWPSRMNRITANWWTFTANVWPFQTTWKTMAHWSFKPIAIRSHWANFGCTIWTRCCAMVGGNVCLFRITLILRYGWNSGTLGPLLRRMTMRSEESSGSLKTEIASRTVGASNPTADNALDRY